MGTADDQRWSRAAYAAEACDTAARRIELSTRHGAALGLRAVPAVVQLQPFTVDIESTVRIPVTYRTLAGRCTEGEDVQVVGGESEASEAQDGEVERILHDTATSAALRNAAGRAPYREVQDGRYLGIRGKDIRWSHPCASCDGDGKVRCGYCAGSGQESCGFCAGTGSRTESTTDDKGHTTWHSVSCGHCFMGSITCSSCGGSGDVDCSACEASGWQTRSSVAKACIAEKRRISADWAHPAFARIFGGTIALEQLAADGLGRIERNEGPLVQESRALRRFHFNIPTASIAMSVDDIREEVFVVGFRPRLQLAEAFLDRLLKDDIDRAESTATQLRWSAPWVILRARLSWEIFRQNEVLEALLQAAVSRSQAPRSRWAGLAWCWRTRRVTLDHQALHADVAGSVSVVTIARSLNAADRLTSFSRAVARTFGGAVLLLAAGVYAAFAVRHVGPLAWIGGSLLGAWAAAESVGWWLGRPLGPLARAR
ncbi:hypothetical protein [uncultured Ramlibacter sp.]|uniref:hypothetical protein n=1 Tax=uncultured Ramlibacter sp. TaxID=260755 RepID=UPI0026281BB9|nr:hypothetical protein [uncultured Ramlibacter sp.]